MYSQLMPSGLSSTRAQSDDPSKWVVLPEIISKEPLGPLVRHGDHQWGDVVRWALNTMIIAEEFNLTQGNVDSNMSSNIPEVLRILGVEGGYGEMSLARSFMSGVMIGKLNCIINVLNKANKF